MHMVLCTETINRKHQSVVLDVGESLSARGREERPAKGRRGAPEGSGSCSILRGMLGVFNL